MIRLKSIFNTSIQALEKFLDYLPLPLLIMGDILFSLTFIADLVGRDFLPFLEEFILGGFLIYLNHYLLLRIFGFISLRRILHLQTLAKKQKLGMIPYEPWLRKSLKLLNTLIREWSQPSASDWLQQEAEHLKKMKQALKHLSLRLDIVDQLFFTSPLNPQHLKEQTQALKRLSKISSRRSKEYYQGAIKAQIQYEKAKDLLSQRNLLVSRIQRFYQMLERVQLFITPELFQKLTQVELSQILKEVRKEFEELDNTLSSHAPDKPSDSPPAQSPN